MERAGRSGKDEVGVVGTEGGRSPTGVPTTPAGPVAAGGPLPSHGPDPEVLEKPTRRRFSAEYKLRILHEADRANQGELGALLRREGLYASHLKTWRRQRNEGALSGLAPKRRGRKAKRHDPMAEENRRLRRENERLAGRLKQAETIIEVQKKLSEALGIEMPDPEKTLSEE